MSEWPAYYILVGRLPVAVDFETWALSFGTPERIVAKTQIDDRCEVSTVCIGLGYDLLDGEPLLFETMIWGGPLGGEMWRYHTYAQAERGHAEAVAQAKIAAAQIKAIADHAGAKS